MLKFKRNNFMNKFNKGIKIKFNNINRRCCCCRNPYEYKVIKQEELKEFLKSDVCIIDVRTPSEYMGLHLKNSINIPLNVLNREILAVAPDKSTKILVYCITGERTFIAISKLNSLEYRNIYIWGNGGLNTLKEKDILEY